MKALPKSDLIQSDSGLALSSLMAPDAGPWVSSACLHLLPVKDGEKTAVINVGAHSETSTIGEFMADIGLLPVYGEKVPAGG